MPVFDKFPFPHFILIYRDKIRQFKYHFLLIRIDQPQGDPFSAISPDNNRHFLVESKQIRGLKLVIAKTDDPVCADAVLFRKLRRVFSVGIRKREFLNGSGFVNLRQGLGGAGQGAVMDDHDPPKPLYGPRYRRPWP